MPADLIETIRDHVLAMRRTGYVAGGSGHLAHVDVANLAIIQEEPATREGKPAILVTYQYEIWIDREFEMTPDNQELFKEVHRERVIAQDGRLFPVRG